MRMMLKVFICLMTASVSLLPVMGKKRGPDNFNCENTPERITALPGGSVTITCKYPRTNESHIKSFYKEDGIYLISSYLSNYTTRDRFSLTDDKQKGVYTVEISLLTENDTGKYQCALKAVEDSSTACLTEIHLYVWNWDDIKPVRNISHVASETAQIECHYPESHVGNDKFLCKGENPVNCEELIQTTKQDRDTVPGRFDIRDNQRMKYFYVYINDLNEADSGTYWCVSGRTMQHDDYTKIHLSVDNITPATPMNQAVDMVHKPLFLTAVMCVAAMLFVCLFTFGLQLAVKNRRSRRRQNREMSSDYETMMPGVRTEPELRCSCSAPDPLALPQPSSDFCPHLMSKHRESTISLDLGEYVDVDVPGHICQYQHLDLSCLEEHVYHCLQGNNGPKNGPVKEQIPCYSNY